MHLRFLLLDESFRLVGAAGEGPAQQELSLVLARKKLLGDEKDEDAEDLIRTTSTLLRLAIKMRETKEGTSILARYERPTGDRF